MARTPKGGVMRGLLLWIAAASAVFVSAARAQDAAPAPLAPALQQAVAALKGAARQSDAGYDFTRDLVAEVGPRLAGTEAEARARDWAVRRLKAMGFANVRVEPFTIPMWRRTAEEFALAAPFVQPLAATALGWSAPTPASGLEGDVVRFPDLAALSAAPAGSLAGKIAFVDERMQRTQDGAGYGAAQQKRRRAAQIAAGKGAIASLIRTAGTNPDRVANTGAASPTGTLTPIPAAALANPDSDQLAHLLARGPVRVRMKIGVETKPVAPSGNVLAEIKGREEPEQIVLLGAHLDSWDITPGAQDDAAGAGTIVAAAKLILDAGKRPRRTIRLVLYGAEEVGGLGGEAYAAAHAGELAGHVLAMESDSGAGAVWQVRTKFADPRHRAAFAAALTDLPMVLSDAPARGATDIGPLRERGVPIIDLPPDTYLYFDIHHTANDTMERIDRANVRKNVAAYAVAAYLAAESGWNFRGASPP